MKILFVNAYFMPETIAFSHLEKDLIEGLVYAGHEIEVICPIPTRSVSNEVYQKYKSIKTEELYDKKVHVRRFWAPREGKKASIRAFRYFWCNLRIYQIGKKYKNMDAIFAVSTPPTQGMLAGRLSKKMNCPFIYSLQDIFPDSLVTTEFAHEDSLIWKIGRWVEQKTYRYAKHIIVISESCKRNLLNKGVTKDKLSLISNWVDIEKIKPVAREKNKLIPELQLNSQNFLVVYAGNFGAAQGADIVLEAAEKLKDLPDVQFIIFGGGAYFEEAKKLAKVMDNVFIHELMSADRISEVYSLGDVALITCKPGTGNAGMPSKTWSIMACNTPIIASFDTDSDLATIIAESGAGCCVTPGSVEELVSAIKDSYDAWKNGHVNNLNLREYVRLNASKEICVKRYIEIIKSQITG